MDGYTKSRVDNVMQMYRNGALYVKGPQSQPRIAHVICQYADELEDKLMVANDRCTVLADLVNEIATRSLLQTLKDWWRWRKS